MNRILSRRIWRDFRSNLLKYTSLALMTMMALFIVISTTTVAEITIRGVEDYAERSRLEDGQFVLFTRMSERDRKEIEDMGVSLEDTSYLDYLLADGTTLRLFKVREKMNLIHVESGKIPSFDSPEYEVLIEKIYARRRGIELGDQIEIGGLIYRVVGIGATSDYDSPMRGLSDFNSDSNMFGTAFVNRELDADLIKEYRYSYRLNGCVTEADFKEVLQKIKISPDEVDDPFFQQYWERLTAEKRRWEDEKREFSSIVKKIEPLLRTMPEESEKFGRKMQEFETHFSSLIDDIDVDTIDNLILFLPREDNPRIEASVRDTRIDLSMGMFAGVIAMILFTYIISIFVVHNIDADSNVIGTLYALGTGRRTILFHYLALPVLITFIGGVAGTVLGMSPVGIAYMSASKYDYFSIVTIPVRYPLYLILYGCLMPPVISFIVNAVIIRKRLSGSALKLMRQSREEDHYADFKLSGLGYLTAFQIRQCLKELRSTIGVVFGIFLSLLVLFIGVDCHILCQNISIKNKEDTKFQYMYMYKYPPAEAPAGGEIALSKVLSKEIYGINFSITLLGLEEDNPYFDVPTKKSKRAVVISSALASKFHLQEGDVLVLKDKQEDMLYAFDITAVSQYSTGFYAFMDIGAMRELFARGEDAFDVVFSDEELDIPSGLLYSVLTKKDIDNASDIFNDLMIPLVYSMMISSVIIFVTSLFLLMKMMLERSRYHISLFKVMGYRDSEIRKLYLDGNFFIILIGTAIALPIAKILMDMSYPYLVANIASELILDMSMGGYLSIYCSIIAVYLVIHIALMKRLKKYTVAEVLKRENS